MQKNTYGVDVSSYQDANLASYKATGSKFAIVKVSQGTNYRNPNAGGQIASAKALEMEVHGYFFATFSNNTSQAILEAQYAVASAKALGLPLGSYLSTDWEKGEGFSYNSVNGDVGYNTQAVLATMDVIAKAGYKPLLYSGAYVLRNNLNTKVILSKYPNSLWVASYPTMDPETTANMNYFPSMDGVAIWQFTSNWKNMSVDANIAVIDSSNIVETEKEDEEMSWHPEINYDELGRFKITRPNGAPLYKSADLKEQVGTRKVGETYKIFKASKGAVMAGTGQWFAQSDGLTKINPLAVNSQASGVVCKIVTDDCWTQNVIGQAQGIKHLAKGSTYKVFGRQGKYLIIGSEKDGKYVDATKTKIILF